MTPSSPRGEEGSIIMAVLVLLVTTLAVLALLISATGSLTLARNDQNRTNAFQYANAGIDQALYRLDQRDLPSIPTNKYFPTLAADGSVVSFTDEITVNGSTFKVFAEQSPAGQTRVWKVRSVGADPSGRLRQAIATVQASPLFVNGFFTLQDFSISGQQTTPVAYRSSVCPDPRTMSGPDCALAPPVPGFLGTNGTFGSEKMSNATAESFKNSWAGFNMYGKPTQAAADLACAEGRCAPKAKAITDPLVVIVPKAPAGAKPCPSLLLPIAPGDYKCVKLDFPAAAVTVQAVPGNVRIWVDTSISAGKGTVVNAGGRPSRFQIFQNMNPDPGASPKGAWPGSICDAGFWALMYTPGLAIDCVGEHEPAFYGAVVAQIKGGAGNQFDFHWDIDSLNAVHNGKYVLKDWRECPASKTDC